MRLNKPVHSPSREVTPALINALNHPVRRHILRLLADGEQATMLSATEMARPPARANGADTYSNALGNHARLLCKQGIIRCSGIQRVRNVAERFYVSNVSKNKVVSIILSSTEEDDKRILRLEPVPPKG